jgi:fluoride ion exporter CrcB/FEX
MNSIGLFLLVGATGGLGAVLRVALMSKMPSFRTLLAINIASSFLIVAVNMLELNHCLRIILAAGFCGGFSSLTAIIVGSIREKGAVKKNLLTILGTVLATLIAFSA